MDRKALGCGGERFDRWFDVVEVKWNLPHSRRFQMTPQGRVVFVVACGVTYM